jgi:hypothetical protein
MRRVIKKPDWRDLFYIYQYQAAAFEKSKRERFPAGQDFVIGYSFL